MKQITPFLIALSLLLASQGGVAKVTETPLESIHPEREHLQTTRIITKVIDKYHYSSAPIDDKLSEAIFTRYLEALDPNRSYFTQRDVQHFSRYRKSLDDSLKSTELEPAFEIFRVYRKRVDERVDRALEVLAGEFDFTRKESYRVDRSEDDWAKDHKALNEQWRKRVKNDFLALRLTGKEDDKIRETLSKRYEGIKRRTHQFDADDVYQIFINAYTLSLEPHTSYMPPRDAENFDINMRLSLEGIGAVLRMENEYTTVQRVIKGGPAAQSGQLGSGDRIVGVGQGRRGDVEDVVGWRLQDVVELIRGPKDSVVRLRILPEKAGSDGPEKTITLVRNKIKLEDQAAKTRILEDLPGLEDLRIGIIEVPTFYRDFQGYSRGDANFKSTTRDVRNLLGELMDEEVDGVIVDLRGNGGGSLTEATELTGLFIPSGPVVQVRKATGELDIEQDVDPEMVYKGPLAVMVDHTSASASEIFAGAIQDYGRGLVIGETTFGKGTVQQLVDLDRFVFLGGSDLGRLRLTMAQFFRVNGGSTQFKGVVPDVPFPTDIYHEEEGERSLDNALPWARIDPAKFRRTSTADFSRYVERSRARVAGDPGFTFLMEEEHALADAREKHTVSLNEAERRREWEETKKERLDRLNRFRVSVGLPPESEEALENEEEEVEHASNDDGEDPEDVAIRDIGAKEAARILADYIEDIRPRSAMVD
jgi:carboxyl-terminal processing protease